MTSTTPAEDLTAREVADELGSTTKFVYNLIDRGELVAIRYGTRFVRIPRASLNAWKAAHSTQTTPAQQLLDEDTRQFLAELAAAAPELSEAQKDTIRAAFRGGGAD